LSKNVPLSFLNMCLTMPSNTSTTTPNPESTGASSTSASLRPPASSSIPPEEAETVGDEVKVFADEDEREESGNDQFHQVGILSDIKSKLITETEQVRQTDRQTTFKCHPDPGDHSVAF
jgi:hypothetical protein